jgi:hypothetical protein
MLHAFQPCLCTENQKRENEFPIFSGSAPTSLVGPPGFEPGISAVLIHRQCEGDVLTSWTTGPIAPPIRDYLKTVDLGVSSSECFPLYKVLTI